MDALAVNLLSLSEDTKKGNVVVFKGENCDTLNQEEEATCHARRWYVQAKC